MVVGCTTHRITDQISVSNPTFKAVLPEPGTTNEVWTKASRIPYKKHRFCSWELDVHTDYPNSKWYAYYQYPGPNDFLRREATNSVFEVTQDASAKFDRKNTVPRDGHISGVWVMLPDEPLGQYSVIIFVNYVPVHIFYFEVYSATEDVQQLHTTDPAAPDG